MHKRHVQHGVRAVVAAALAATTSIALAATPAGAGGGCHRPRSEGSGDTIDLRSACVVPTVLHTTVGSTVTFVNEDRMPHNVSSTDFYRDLPSLGDSMQHKFTEPGTYAYACTLHLGMSGAIVVGEGRDRDTDAVTTDGIQPIAARTAVQTRNGVPIPIAIVGGLLIAIIAALAGRALQRRATQ